MAPRIGIPVPTLSDLEYNRRSWPQYASAIQRSGGSPVQIDLGSPSTIGRIAAQCDGFVLPGSPADVLPSRYGQAADPLTAPADLAREACDHLLLDTAESRGNPVLGICFGLQSMNVWRGGTLVQHLTPMPVNHAAGREVAVAHTALVTKTSGLAGLLDRDEAQDTGEFLRLPINTSHHQAVAIPGDRLLVVARSPEDGVIEAVEASQADHPEASALLGVQWHPERSYDISPTSRALFRWLVAEASACSTRRAVLANG